MECITCPSKDCDTKGFVYDTSYSLPTYAVINLTNQCNLRCTYCFVDQNPEIMTLETARQCCEYVLRNKEISNSPIAPGITFFGGEPLLHKDLIYQIVSEYYPRLDFCITTNGVLLDEDFMLFCYKHRISVMVSMDGDRVTQERQRPMADGSSSFDAVMQNIHYYILMSENSLMRATLTKESIPELYHNYLFAKNQGFDGVTFVLNDLTERYSKCDWEKYNQQMDLIAIDVVDDLINDRKAIKVLALEDLYTRASKSINDSRVLNELKRCGFGTTSCGVKPNGDIIHCQEKSSCSDVPIFGNVWDGIDYEVHKASLEAAYHNMANIECPNDCCTYCRAFCKNSQCPSRLENRGFVINPDVCEFTKINFKIGGRLDGLFTHSRFQPRFEIKEACNVT